MGETKENKKNQVETEFYKTPFGKLIGFTAIVTGILLAVGIVLMGFEAVCYAKDLNIDKYRQLFVLGNVFITFSLLGAVGCSAIYGIFVPKSGNKKDEKALNEEFDYLKLGLVIIIGTWYVSLFYYIGYSVGLLIAG